jgi:hypothetical protein
MSSTLDHELLTLVAPFSSTVVSKRTLSQGPLAQLPPALWTPLVDPADLQAEHAEAALEVPPPLFFLMRL